MRSTTPTPTRARKHTDTPGPPDATRLVIRGGRVIDPASGLDERADILVEQGVVAAIETDPAALSTEPRAAVIDAEGCLVAPGLIDPHVHLREPSLGQGHRDTIRSGCATALAGGFTSVCCMPNTAPPIDTPQRVADVLARGRDAAGSRCFVVAAATIGRHGEVPAPIEAMAEAGAVGFTDDGDAVADAEVLEKILAAVRACERVFMQHCQDPALAGGGVMHAGPRAVRLGLDGWPPEGETAILERDLHLVEAIGARYHAQHLSCAGSVDIVRRARSQGMPVTAEVTPHHLLLTEDACEGWHAQAKVNPPLRTTDDIAHLLEGVADGTITVLGTDHAPHPLASKITDFATASFGFIGLEHALPLYVRALLEPGVLGWPELLAMMTVHPAALTGLDRLGLGRLQVGGPADLVVIDPNRPVRIDARTLRTAARNTPFDGWEVSGAAIATIVAGRVHHRLDQHDT